jgi:hypothetical protein
MLSRLRLDVPRRTAGIEEDDDRVAIGVDTADCRPQRPRQVKGLLIANERS